MKVSKTQFVNLMRCDRFAALNEIYHEKNKAIVSITDDVEIEDLMSLENQQYKSVILESMYDVETDEDLIYDEDPQIDMMMPYYNKLEMLSGRAIKNRFEGNIIFDLDTFNQKRFAYLKEGFSFYCFLDGYQEDDKAIRIFETKATTSNKFSEDNFSYSYTINKEKYKDSFFVELPSGIFVPREDLGQEVHPSYYKKEAQVMDRFHGIGKYVYDLSYQRYVFEKTYTTDKNREYFLVVLNHEYVHDGKVDELGEPVYNDNIVKFYNMTSITKKMMKVIEEDTNLAIKRLNEMDAKETKLGKHCQRGKNTQCPFYDICHGDFPKDNSIFIYKGRHHGFKEIDGTKHELYDLINEGARTALDVPREYLNRPNNIIQRDVIENEEVYYNKQKIRMGLTRLKYPIYHLDFESLNAPLPRFRGESPYMQSLFQYSIHIEHEINQCDKELDHYGYLAKDHKDIRLELLESMLSVIKPDNGSVLVYNVSFERTRLKELQVLFPQHFDALEDIIDRLFDLQHIVETNSKLYQSLGFDEEDSKLFNFYHEKLNGSFSIKKVLPLFSDLTYAGMRVGNGTEAMGAYSRFEELTGAEYEETYNDLVNYCKQDTWAMFEILRALRKI